MEQFQPKIRMYSKYERRTDTRTYEDRKKLYEGVIKPRLALNSGIILISQGWEILYCEVLEKDWKEKLEEFGKHARGNELIELFNETLLYVQHDISIAKLYNYS